MIANKATWTAKMSFACMICAACIMFLLMTQTARSATSLGSVTDAKTADASAGGTVTFRVLMFNAHENSTLSVVSDAEGPEEWDVFVQPESFDLLFSPPGYHTAEEGYECLGTGEGDVMARVVSVSAGIPAYAEPGRYDIRLTSRAGKAGGSMNMRQSRTFRFTVIVRDGTEMPPNNSPNNSPKNSPDIADDAASSGASESGDTSAGDDDSDNMAVPGTETENVNESAGSNAAPLDGGSAIKGADKPSGATGMLVAGMAGYGIIALVILLMLFVSWKIYKHD